MDKRYVTIWFQHLATDWCIRHNLSVKDEAFVLVIKERGRVVIKEASIIAQTKGIYAGMVLADARAFYPSLQVINHTEGVTEKLLAKFCEWCIRYTPIACIDLPDGLVLDVTGCPHLWGSEKAYIDDIAKRLTAFGYHVRIAMADTIGAAWAVSRFGKDAITVVDRCAHINALLSLPPASLRIDELLQDKLHKLGFYQISSFINIPTSMLRRRFGKDFIKRFRQALGKEEETVKPFIPVEPYTERLPCLEHIQTLTGIEIALNRLLEMLCKCLQKESKGLRTCSFKCFRLDSKVEQVSIGTTSGSNNAKHLFKLFENKLQSIEPDLGIELFVLEASKVEDLSSTQEVLWESNTSNNKHIAELLDRISNKFENISIQRFLPNEHHLPERSYKKANALDEQSTATWLTDKQRPTVLLEKPELIKVTAPVPDYPPMSFTHKNNFHRIKKADGPERIESEWWLNEGLFRDYYVVEVEEGKRYWLFRLGSYDGAKLPSWFLHGFFA
jgi:protein ImuB